MGQAPLEGYVVVDLSSGISGGYCTKVLADGGADVIKVEDPAGDWLRGWTASGAELAEGDDGALFQFLAGSKGRCRRRWVRRRISISLLGWCKVPTPSSGRREAVSRDMSDFSRWRCGTRRRTRWCARSRPSGLNGPWADRPATEATLQAMAGGLMTRGDPQRPPVLEGGDIGEWTAGMCARRRIADGAVAQPAQRDRRSGRRLGVRVARRHHDDVLGDVRVDRRQSDASQSTDEPAGHPRHEGRLRRVHGGHWPAVARLLRTRRTAAVAGGRVAHPVPDPGPTPPGVARCDRCLDGGALDGGGAGTRGRAARPAAEVGNGATIPHFDQLAARHWYVRNPRGGFLQPDVPYTLSAGSRRPAEPAPRLGEHTQEIREQRAGPQDPDRDERRCWACPLPGFACWT